jgi:hypothetical protein
MCKLFQGLLHCTMHRLLLLNDTTVIVKQLCCTMCMQQVQSSLTLSRTAKGEIALKLMQHNSSKAYIVKAKALCYLRSRSNCCWCCCCWCCCRRLLCGSTGSSAHRSDAASYKVSTLPQRALLEQRIVASSASMPALKQ